MTHFDHPGPPHSHWHGPRRFRPGWEGKRRFLFFRFARLLGFALLLFLIGMGGLAFFLVRLFGGGGQVTGLVWLVGIGVAIAFPVLAGVIAIRSFAGFANPVARVMDAAEAVAGGDLSARVPEMGPGEFGRLARSFNHMVSELEQADQLRRNLTADVAHELRTPLHILQGNLEALLDGVYEPSPEQLDLLLDETRQLARLVDDLRTLSLAEAGQLTLKRETLDVAELLSDTATSFSGQAEAAGIELRLEVDPSPAPLTVTGDAGRLDQVLSNLVANAIRHTPPGGAITLRAGAIPGTAGVRIQVADNGSGIPPEDLPNIFDRFWRGDALSASLADRGQGDARSASPAVRRQGDRSRQDGTGLGLAIARRLIQAHGGTISVESQAGKGTTFTIEL